jgi:hypothetical protein
MVTTLTIKYHLTEIRINKRSAYLWNYCINDLAIENAELF